MSGIFTYDIFGGDSDSGSGGDSDAGLGAYIGCPPLNVMRRRAVAIRTNMMHDPSRASVYAPMLASATAAQERCYPGSMKRGMHGLGDLVAAPMRSARAGRAPGPWDDMAGYLAVLRRGWGHYHGSEIGPSGITGGRDASGIGAGHLWPVWDGRNWVGLQSTDITGGAYAAGLRRTPWGNRHRGILYYGFLPISAVKGMHGLGAFDASRCTGARAMRMQTMVTHLQQQIAHRQSRGRQVGHLQARLASIQRFLDACHAAASSAPIPSGISGTGSYYNE